ncbi:MAG: glycosyltransferase family 4 protein [Salinivirgaceae bacterium]|nr:glycosyltransferase family 4 protein [Salinivirgaceae bacterium]
MKIVFVNSCKSWGGGEKWHFEMASALNHKGFEVSAIGSPSSIFSDKITHEKILLKKLKVRGLSFLNPIKLFKLSRYFKKLAPDAIIINLSADLKLAGFAAKIAGVKSIIYRRGSAIPIKNKPLNRFIFKNIVTNVLANSLETKNTVLANNKTLFPEELIHVIYNGVHLSDFTEIFTKEEKDPIVLGNLARLSYQKGQKYLINLAEKLKQENFNFKLLIGGEGELEEELKKMVVEKQLSEYVEFVGFVSDAKAFLEQLDIFVFPSIWEGFGFSIIEAKLCKKPVVAFKISSNPEVIVESKDGFLVAPFDEDAFFEKTKELIENKQLRKQMGEKGRADALNRFSHEKCVAEVEKYLLSLTNCAE